MSNETDESRRNILTRVLLFAVLAPYAQKLLRAVCVRLTVIKLLAN